MKRHIETWPSRVLALSLAVLLIAAAAVLPLDAGTCERALQRCLADAMLAGVLGLNLQLLALFSTSCLLGYSWCLKYYDGVAV